MNSEIDAELREILSGLPETEGYLFLTGIGNAEVPEGPFIVCTTEQAEHVAGGFHRATGRIYVSTPALPGEGDWFPRHNMLRAGIHHFLLSGELADEWDSNSIDFCGLHVVNSQQSTEEDRWVWTCEVVMGVRYLTSED
jgi:hypothetical protein